jgi:hypothetical protein
MNDGGPAFPVPNYVNVDGDTFESKPSGMSLRDWFAGQALVGLLSAGYGETAPHVAYDMADRMLEER